LEDAGGVPTGGDLNRKANYEGAPIKPLGLTSWALAVFFTAALVAVGLFLTLTSYARRETVTGVLMPTAGAIEVSTVRAGLIRTVHVTEGQVVSVGASLITLSLDSDVEGGRGVGDLMSEAAIQQEVALKGQATARQSIAVQRGRDYEIRRDAAQEEITSLLKSRDLVTSQVAMALKLVEAGRPLQAKGYVSLFQMSQWEQALIQAQTQQNTIEQRISQGEAKLKQLSIEGGQLRAEAAEEESQFANSRAELKQKQATILGQRDVVIRAKISGRIAALRAKEGNVVQAGAVIATVLPKADGLQAELWAPSRAMAFLRPGQSVRLMYDAFPFQRFGTAQGRVSEISSAPVNPAALPIATDGKEGLYSVHVALNRQFVHADGKEWALKPGMRLTADIVLEKRLLLAWLFEPLLAANARAKDSAVK
jgi:membrane fusion protein